MPRPGQGLLCCICKRPLELHQGRHTRKYALIHKNPKSLPHAVVPFGWFETAQQALQSNTPKHNTEAQP